MAVYPNGLTTRPIVSDPFGWRVHPIYGDLRLHGGTDSYGHPGGLNYAPEGGVVSYAGYNGGAGNQVSIDVPGTNRQWRLKHHQSFRVSYGQTIRQATPTGVTGTTGDSTGVHCHTELSIGGLLVDPFAWIASHLGGFAGDGTPFNNRRRKSMTQLFSFTMPATVPAEWLAENVDLKAGKPSYLAIGDGIDFVTQVQGYIADYAKQQFGEAVYVNTNPNEALRLWRLRRSSISSGGGGGVPPEMGGVVAAINTGFDRLSADVKALPSEIDAYNDGRK